MEKMIKIKADATGSEMEMNLDTIKDGLEKHVIEYGEELQKMLKAKTVNKENVLDVTVGENTYRILIDKCPYSGKYRICAFNLKPVGSNFYNVHMDFKVLSGGNVAKMMRYMLEAIVACGEDAEISESELEDIVADEAAELMHQQAEEINETISELNDILENARRELQHQTPDYAWLADKLECIPELVKTACHLSRDLSEVSELTGCEMVWEDFISEPPTVYDMPYGSEDFENTESDYILETILDYLFGGEKNENALDLRSTLHHYWIAA